MLEENFYACRCLCEPKLVPRSSKVTMTKPKEYEGKKKNEKSEDNVIVKEERMCLIF